MLPKSDYVSRRRPQSHEEASSALYNSGLVEQLWCACVYMRVELIGHFK
eukprot:COSAG05_NODE_10453_length_564_cov_6.574661_1_plen_48_part_01